MNRIIHPIEPEELMAYLDGELTADRASVTAAHLSACEECQGLVAELRGLSEELKAWKLGPTKPDIPPAIATSLAKNRLASRTVSPRAQRWWGGLGHHRPTIAFAGGAAVLLLAAVSLPNLLRNRGTAMVSLTKPKTSAYLVAPESPPTAAPMSRGEFDKLSQSAKLQSAPNAKSQLREPSSEGNGLAAVGPMIIRTAQLSVITKEFDKARANLEAILNRHRGYVGELNAGGGAGSGRTLTATLRVPADQLDATLAEVKTLGRVVSESQNGKDVTSQYVDLQARVGNARNTEQRLTDLLRNRTGKLSDVLAVEQELDRVRGEIEQMEAERKNMSNQVSYATLTTTIMEDYKAELQVVPPSTFTRLSNAAVEGYRGMADGVIGLALFLLSIGPSLLLWGAVLFFPARLVWRKLFSRVAP